MPKKSRLQQTLIAFDQVFNALASGWADETLSARAYRLDGTKRRWTVARRVIDALFFWQRQHCWQAYRSEQSRLHLPPAYRAEQ